MSTDNPSNDSKGKCISCGFLGELVRVNDLNHPDFPARIIEVKANMRAKFVLSYAPDSIFHCLLQKSNLLDEMLSAFQEAESKYPPKVYKEVLCKDRNCAFWYAYQEQCSPKEHVNMLRADHVENQRRELQLRLAEMDRQIQEGHTQTLEGTQQAVSDLKTVMELSERAAERVNRWVIILAVMQIIAAIVSIIITLKK